MNLIMKKVVSVKGAIIQSPNNNNSRAAKLAIRDSALILTYCYQNFKEIVDIKEDLDKMFKAVISNFLMLASGNLE